MRKLGERYLPKSIVLRNKEKFATRTRIGAFLEAYADQQIALDDFENFNNISTLKMNSKEELLYWRLFERDYNRDDILTEMGTSRSLNENQRWIKETGK